MKKTLPFLAVVTLLLPGCGPVHRLAVIPNANNTRFELQNISGRDLHDVRLKGWMIINGQGLTYVPKEIIGDVTWDERLPSQLEFPYGFEWIEFRGRCREGRVWVDFNAAVRPVEPPVKRIEAKPPPPAPPTETKYESSEAEMQRHLDKLKTPR